MVEIVKQDQFRHNVFLLFPDITNHKHLLSDGEIDTLKLVKATNYQIGYDREGRGTYQTFYNYLEENKHLYEWWML